jgi:hypothetical protein
MNNSEFAGSLEEIREHAEGRRSPLARFFSPVYLRPTSAYPGVKAIDEDVEERSFRPNMLRLVVIGGFIGAALCAILYNAINADTYGTNHGLIIGLIAAFSIACIYLFVRPRLYTITLNRKGISVGGPLLPWNTIRETAILVVRTGKLRRHYLVLWFRDGSYERYRLDDFTAFSLYGFPAVLSSWIGYFRKGS